ncbi:choline transport protein [Ceratobasidium sp. AG-Ba]|nr:choline transport protein [Ceratobasidium sp. AG-Ba]QRW15053.1 choline transport protein [Ceratobasidium sp. AG-Ba]
MPRLHDLPTIDTRPAGASSRTLVLCFDGTTNVYDDHNTNIVKLFTLLEKDNRDKQMVYYQPGVGTYAPPGIFMPASIAIAKVLDQGIALYLDKHVMGGYEFLMKHYNDGDRICLFGFSRGAYTARALAGMLNKVGLLPPGNIEQIPFAYSMYKRNDAAGFKASAGFKKAFCRTVRIEFIGVWDTVSSVGLLWPRHLPFTNSNTIVKTFRHAVSLDEHRAKFKQNVWHVHAPDPIEASRDPDQGSPVAPKITSRVRTSPSTTLPETAPHKHGSAVDQDIHVAAPMQESSTINNPTHAALSQAGRGQTDLRDFFKAISVGSRNRGEGSDRLGEGWHSRDPTHVHSARPDSGVGVLEQDLDTKKNSSVEPGSSYEPAVGNSMNTSLKNAVEEAGFQAPPKSATKLSGGVAFEEAWRKRHPPPDGFKELDTDILEVWFAGCHSDVGGGSLPNKAKYSLSNVSLRWMIRQIILSQCGIQFNQAALKDMDIPLPTLTFGRTDPNAIYSYDPDAAVVKEAREREQFDALAPVHDALKSPLWWPLEFSPLIHSYQDEKGKWHRSFRWNLFRPRHARKTLGVIKLHKSVEYRQKNSNYKPRAILDGDIEYVE